MAENVVRVSGLTKTFERILFWPMSIYLLKGERYMAL